MSHNSHFTLLANQPEIHTISGCDVSSLVRGLNKLRTTSSRKLLLYKPSLCFCISSYVTVTTNLKFTAHCLIVFMLHCMWSLSIIHVFTVVSLNGLTRKSLSATELDHPFIKNQSLVVSILSKYTGMLSTHILFQMLLVLTRNKIREAYTRMCV